MKSLKGANALVVGVGPGIGRALARKLVASGAHVSVAARDLTRLQPLASEVGAAAYEVDASDPDSVADLFRRHDEEFGSPQTVIYNASSRPARTSVLDIEPRTVAETLAITATGGLLVLQQAARRMAALGEGAIILTGATASTKGFASSAAFAMGKFALRGLAQSAARELGPLGIHVAHVMVDGVVLKDDGASAGDAAQTMNPDAIAETYLHLIQQERSAWTLEMDLRPFDERF